MEKAIHFSLLFLYLALPFYLRLGKGIKKKDNNRSGLASRYYKFILFTICLAALLFLLIPQVFHKLDFLTIGKGILINDNIVFYCMLFVTVPIMVELLPLKKSKEENLEKQTELFGEDSNLLPTTNREFIAYCAYTVFAVGFEEFFFRQFGFYILSSTLYLKGDSILFISSLLFTIGHEYKKIVQLLFIFILGLVLGKVFQFTGSLLYPVVMHLCLNLTQVVMVLKKIRKSNNVAKYRSQ